MPKVGKGKNGGSREVLYKSVEARLCAGKTAITADAAREILGWEEESDKIKFGDSYVREILPIYGKKVRCHNNVTNRPIYAGTIATLMQEILRKKWALNGETIIIGKTGLILNGQHTLISLVIADSEWAKDSRWKENWKTRPTIDKVLVLGIEEDDATVNTMDTCKPRSLSDVIYRSEYFAHLNFADRRAAARVTDYAIRLLWDRTGVGLDAFAPRRTHAESLDFLDRHQKLLEAVSHIQAEEGKDRRISKYVAPGYAAALLYLMGCSNCDPEEYKADPKEQYLSWDLWDKASEFWVLLAAGAEEMAAVRPALAAIINNGGGTGAERCALVIKAWQCFVKGKKIKPQDLELLYIEDQDGVRHLDECPIVGGIDIGSSRIVDEEIIVADDPDEDEIKARAKNVRVKRAKLQPSKAGKKWAKNDVAWVRSNDGDHYLARITDDIYETESGQLRCMVVDADSGEWDVAVDDLSLQEPKGKGEPNGPSPRDAKSVTRASRPEKDPGGPFQIGQRVWVLDDEDPWRGKIIEMVGKNAKLRVETGHRGAGTIRAASVSQFRIRQPEIST